jgi:hypothetical protein
VNKPDAAADRVDQHGLAGLDPVDGVEHVKPVSETPIITCKLFRKY